MLERLFGTTITLSTGRVLPVRFVGEQHVLEDLGRIPTVQDWLGKIQPESWMLGKGREHARELDALREMQASNEGVELCPDRLTGGG